MIGSRGAVTFRDLDRRQRRVVGALRAGGIEERDRIAIVATNRPETIEVVMGSLRAGVVPVPVNPLLTDREVRYVLEDSGARWLFADAGIKGPGPPPIERTVWFGGPYEDLLEEAPEEPLGPRILGRPMHYTSGTTGVPKGVYVAPSSERSAAASQRFRRLWGTGEEDIHLVCSPLAHSAPLRFALRTLEAGGRVVLRARFDAHDVLRTIEHERVTSTFMVPTHLERLLRAGRVQDANLASVRLLAHAGAPIKPATKRSVIALFPEDAVWEFYGSTEGQATRISSAEWLERPGSVGRALPGAEILVTNAASEPLPVGEVGEVWVHDPDAERFSYWGDEAKTAAAWRGEAFSVGDLGYLDADGYLYLTGRKHDTIITGGVNVYPQEVEGILHEHPQVAEAMVFGAPDEEWGQQVRARVVAAPGESVDPEELRRWTRERLAGFKTPRVVEIVDELPRTPTGKLRRVP